MKYLAIDTSSVACSVALQVGDEVIERHEEQAREHTRLLMPMIREVLAAAAIKIGDLDAIVLGNGPGSFIGMRIAASVSQGLAHGAGIKIIPVSSLAAVAAAAFEKSKAAEVVVAQDAHMNEVYLGRYGRDALGKPVDMAAECLHPQAMIELDATTASSRVAVGDGWRRYPELLTLNQHLFGIECDERYPQARLLLALADSNDAVSPQAIEPAYLRHKVAEKPRKTSP